MKFTERLFMCIGELAVTEALLVIITPKAAHALIAVLLKHGARYFPASINPPEVALSTPYPSVRTS